MQSLLFFILLVSVWADPDYLQKKASIVGALRSNLASSFGENAGENFAPGLRGDYEDTLTLTVSSTVDYITTVTSTVYNSIPVTLTNFVKTTRVKPTQEVITTAVNDAIYVTSVLVTRPETTTVTDVSTQYSVSLETSTEIYSILHVDEHIKPKTVTRTTIQTRIYQPTIVHTVLRTEKQVVTVTHHDPHHYGKPTYTKSFVQY